MNFAKNPAELLEAIKISQNRQKSGEILTILDKKHLLIAALSQKQTRLEQGYHELK